jgi:hypothetical protein
LTAISAAEAAPIVTKEAAAAATTITFFIWNPHCKISSRMINDEHIPAIGRMTVSNSPQVEILQPCKSGNCWSVSRETPPV